MFVFREQAKTCAASLDLGIKSRKLSFAMEKGNEENKQLGMARVDVTRKKCRVKDVRCNTSLQEGQTSAGLKAQGSWGGVTGNPTSVFVRRQSLLTLSGWRIEKSLQGMNKKMIFFFFSFNSQTLRWFWAFLHNSVYYVLLTSNAYY